MAIMFSFFMSFHLLVKNKITESTLRENLSSVEVRIGLVEFSIRSVSKIKNLIKTMYKSPLFTNNRNTNTIFVKFR